MNGSTEERIPWREKLSPARWMDTHEVILTGGPDAPLLRDVESLFRDRGMLGLARPARWLFSLRTQLGKHLGWDTDQETPREPLPESYFWRMSTAEVESCPRPPGERQSGALLLWNTDTAMVVEVLNATCQAFAVMWLEGRRASLAVFVIETKWWSKYYLALIEPFRKYLVYPAMCSWLESSWREHFRS